MKSKKTLLILLVVLVVLVGGIIAIKALSGSDAQDETATVEEDYTALYTVAQEEISKITYTYGGETLTFVKQEENWSLEGEENFPLNSSIVETMAGELSEVKLYKQIETEEDLGFESDGIEVTVEAVEKYHFVLGMENSQIGKGYLLTDTSEVYTTSTSLRDAFEYARADLITADEMPEIDTSDITGLTIENGEKSYRFIEHEAQDFYNAFVFSLSNAAGETPLEYTKATDFLEQITGLYLICADYAPDAETVAQAGFDEPVTITIDYTVTEESEDGEDTTEREESYRISLGAEFSENENAYRYVMLEDSDMLFYANQAAVEKILEPAMEDLTPAAVCEVKFSQIKEFTFTLDGETHTATRETQEDETVCYYDGKEINYGYVESFFLDMTLMQSEGGYTEEVSAEKPAVTAKFVIDNDGSEEEYTLNIYEYNANFCIADFSGRLDQMLVSVRDVDALSDSLAELAKNAAR